MAKDLAVLKGGMEDRELMMANNDVQDVESRRAIAEVQAAVIMAKKFPRNKIKAMDDIKQDCCRESLAQISAYSFPRGKGTVTGPTIRLIEMIAQNWGNITYGWNEIIRHKGYSEVEAWAWDIEKNIRIPIKFTVNHIRDTQSGGKILTDERDIYEICANMAARRMRKCLQSIIPGDVIDQATEYCRETISTKCQITPEKIQKLLVGFEKHGVTKAQIEAKIGMRVADINGPTYYNLVSIGLALRDGMTKPHEYFEDIPEPANTDKLKEKLSGEKAKEEPKPAEEKQPEQPDEPQPWNIERYNAIIKESQPLKLIVNVKCLTPSEVLPILEKHNGDLKLVVAEIDAMPKKATAGTSKAGF